METFDTDTKVAVLQNEIKNLTQSVMDFRRDSREQHLEMLSKINSLNERLTLIERWKWMVLGGAVVIGYMLSHMKVIPNIFN